MIHGMEQAGAISRLVAERGKMQNSVSPPQSFLNPSLAKKEGNCCEARCIVFSIGVFVSLTDGFDFL